MAYRPPRTRRRGSPCRRPARRAPRRRQAPARSRRPGSPAAPTAGAASVRSPRRSASRARRSACRSVPTAPAPAPARQTFSQARAPAAPRPATGTGSRQWHRPEPCRKLTRRSARRLPPGPSKPDARGVRRHPLPLLVLAACASGPSSIELPADRSIVRALPAGSVVRVLSVQGDVLPAVRTAAIDGWLREALRQSDWLDIAAGPVAAEAGLSIAPTIDAVRGTVTAALVDGKVEQPLGTVTFAAPRADRTL